jgi:putative phage-type endonuclease
VSDDRRGFIGGSDVAGILGLSPWASPWSVWAEKTGLYVPERGDDMDERLAIGTDAEGFLASVFNRHHQLVALRVDPKPAELKNSQWPWLHGHADGMVVHTGSGEMADTHPDAAGWEAKTAREFTPWSEVPAYYQCQAQTYMMLSGLDSWWFTVGFAGWKVKHYVVLADAEDQDLIAKATEKFWNDHVLTGVPPEADGHDATTQAIKHAYSDPDTYTTAAYADDEQLALIASLRTVKADAKAMEKQQTELENRIKAFLQDSEELRYGDQVLATWKKQDDTRLDAKALKAELPDVAERFTTTKTIRKFLVKEER